MSRYNTQSEFEPATIHFGWDNPLQKFWIDGFYEDENEPYFEGWYKTLEELESRFFAEVGRSFNDVERAQLQSDYDNRTEPTPLQKVMMGLFG